MGRRPTKKEADYLRFNFRNLDTGRVLITDEPTWNYNCLAWTLGITNRWIWPWRGTNATKEQFDALYRKHNLFPARDGHIASYGSGKNKLLHGAISGRGHGLRWESKLGHWFRIQHGLKGLSGGTYGNIIGFYRKRRPSSRHSTPSPHLMGDDMIPDDYRYFLTEDDQDVLERELVKIPESLRVQFETLYEAWQATWSDPHLILSSNPADYAASQQFHDLIEFGKGNDILALLMEKLTIPDQFFALQAVDELSPQEIVVQFDLDDDAVLDGEQGRAQETVLRWLALQN